MSIESFSIAPLNDIAPSYLYLQYSDDEDLQAFVNSYNSISQGYLDWFNNTPMGVYTSGYISGQLLDWIANGIYGIKRPYLSSAINSSYGEMNSVEMNYIAMNDFIKLQSGTSQILNDDIYKRLITWHTFKGDGFQMSINWMRRRITRFLYGINGSDVPVDYNENISMSPFTIIEGPTNTVAINKIATNSRRVVTIPSSNSITVTIPSSPISIAFKSLLDENYFAIPFQINLTVALV